MQSPPEEERLCLSLTHPFWAEGSTYSTFYFPGELAVRSVLDRLLCCLALFVARPLRCC